MAFDSDFKGFPVESVEFYNQLRDNNSKTWFEEHKTDFEKYVMEPARVFVKEMGKELRKISPAIVADTRYNRSIFRPFRDIRFSKDKSPYKTHLGVFFLGGPSAQNGLSRLLFPPGAAKSDAGSGEPLFLKRTFGTLQGLRC